MESFQQHESRNSLRPYEDSFRAVSAPPRDEIPPDSRLGVMQRKLIDDIFTSSSKSGETSVSFRSAKEIGDSMHRPHSTMELNQTNRNILASALDEVPEELRLDCVRGTLESLSASIAELSMGSFDNFEKQEEDDYEDDDAASTTASVEALARAVNDAARRDQARRQQWRQNRAHQQQSEAYWRNQRTQQSSYQSPYISQMHRQPQYLVEQQTLLQQQQILQMEQHRLATILQQQALTHTPNNQPYQYTYGYPGVLDPKILALQQIQLQQQQLKMAALQQQQQQQQKMQATHLTSSPRLMSTPSIPHSLPRTQPLNKSSSNKDMVMKPISELSPSSSGSPAPIFSSHDLRGRVAQLCRDQHGSRFLQSQLDVSGETAEKAVILQEVLPKTRELATDVFGNYVVQKVLTCGIPTARDAVAIQLKGHCVTLSLHVYGCRVVQKALDELPPKQALDIVTEFRTNVLNCVHDQNGNHVIQKCVQVTAKAKSKATNIDFSAMNRKNNHLLPNKEYIRQLSELGDQIQFILAAFQNRVKQLAMHSYGCRVLQRVLEHCHHDQSAQILDELRRTELKILIEDQYANYVVQHAIQYGRLEDRNILISYVRKNLVDFSKHKFASNVVEKSLVYGTQDQRNLLIDEIVGGGTSPDPEATNLRLLITDAFANYVIQKVVDLATDNQLAAIVNGLRPYAQQVKHTPGKHILSKLEKRIPGLKLA